MGMDQTLYVMYETHDTKTYNGCPIDIPLSVEPSCGMRHIDDVEMVFVRAIEWCREPGIDRFMRYYGRGETVSEESGYCLKEVPESTILTLRDELRKIIDGKKSNICLDEEMYTDGEDGFDIDMAKRDYEILDRHLHEDDVRFFYECSY